jgi:DNA-binding transcriptional ArsR family regulator
VKPIPITEETQEVASRIIWFEAPERALREPIRFMAYAMTYARHEDMRVLRRHVSDDDIREALDKAPPGIIDPRSWAYWNSKMGRYPAPPLPQRKFTDPGNSQYTGVSEPTLGRDLGSAREIGLEGVRKEGRAAWRILRERSGPTDLEEIRRKACEEWRAEYGGNKKT